MKIKTIYLNQTFGGAKAWVDTCLPLVKTCWIQCIMTRVQLRGRDNHTVTQKARDIRKKQNYSFLRKFRRPNYAPMRSKLVPSMTTLPVVKILHLDLLTLRKHSHILVYLTGDQSCPLSIERHCTFRLKYSPHYEDTVWELVSCTFCAYLTYITVQFPPILGNARSLYKYKNLL